MSTYNLDVVLSTLSEDISIDRKFCRNLENNKALCLVHHDWLRTVQQAKALPKHSPAFELCNEDPDLLLRLKSPTSIPKNWKLVLVSIIPKHRGKVFRLPDRQRLAKPGSSHLSFSQLIHYVSETNYKNLWKYTHNKYHPENQKERKTRKNELQSYNSAVKETIRRIYGCSIVLCSKRVEGDLVSDAISFESLKMLETCHPNLLSAYFALESVETFYLFQPYPPFSLYDVVAFSPAALSLSTGRCLFVFYQLLHCLSHLLDAGLHLGNISLSDVYLNQEIWVQVTPRLWEDMLNEAESIENQRKAETRDKNLENFKKEERLKKSKLINDYLNLWVVGQMSNFDYLMELNKLAGREMNNPKHHPVLPWIIDFTSPDGGWRDLSKSKYRLTKGDRQLDLTYESSSTSKSAYSGHLLTGGVLSLATQVPHHFSEVLSDITYYVYKARRMPKSVLCKHVRSNWVPAEYPASIQRLQVWTPDECIPEFYTDGSIFKSCHEDLSDLEVPSWSTDAEDFVVKHKQLLESDHVSERLHYWIDLTFGYKLSGSSAVKSKNVCLPLVDKHTTLNSSGMTQLFNQPHPHKMATSIFAGRKAPKTFRSISQKSILQSLRTKDSQDVHFTEKDITNENLEEDSESSTTTSSKSEKSDSLRNLRRSKSMLVTSLTTLDTSKVENRPENQVIVLPKDYNPLAELQQVESLFHFSSQTIGVGSVDLENKNKESESLNQHRLFKTWDMVTLGCVLSQMALPSRFHVVPKSLPLQDTYSLVLRVLQVHSHELPKCAAKAVKLLLQLNFPITNVDAPIPTSYPPITMEGLPPMSAPHQLMQPLINILPFSAYYHELYTFICQLNKFDQELDFAESLTINDQEKLTLLRGIADEKVLFTSQKLVEILPRLDSEGVNLLIPFLLHMFENRWTSLLAVWHLFEPIAQTLGLQLAGVKLVGTISKLLDPDVPSAKHLKLYHRSCLLKLIVRLGLQTFLTHFVTLIIEATGGVKDFSVEGSDAKKSDATDSFRKSSHLQSTELEIMGVDPDTLNPEGNVSPYDEDTNLVTMTSRSPEKANSALNESEQTDEMQNFSYEESQNEEPEIFAFESTDDDLPINKSSEQIETWRGGNSPSTFTVDHNDGSSDSEENENNRIPESEVPTEELAESNQSYDTTDTSAFSDDKQNRNVHAYKISSNGFKKSPNGSHDDIAYNISDVASESVLWLAHRLGPVLTARFLSRNLLKMLTLCYLGSDQKQHIEESLAGGSVQISLTGKWIAGDNNASKVLECLGNIVELYGESFVIAQYLPHAADLINLCKRRITENLESGLIGMLSLMQFVVPYLSDTTLMDHLQDRLIKDILYPAAQLATSVRFNYPGGQQVRLAVASKLVNVLYIIGLRIGFEMTRKHLSAILQRFFSAFEKAHENLSVALSKTHSPIAGPATSDSSEEYIEIKKSSVGDEYVIGSTVRIKSGAADSLSPQPNLVNKVKSNAEPLDELRQVFTPELAFCSYIPFCKLAGGIFMEQTLSSPLLHHLCSLHDQTTETKIKLYESSPSKDLSRFGDSVKPTELVSSGESSAKLEPVSGTSSSKGKEECMVSGEFGRNVAIIGNRINVNPGEDGQHLNSVSETASTTVDHKQIPGGSSHCDASLLTRKMENNYRHLKGNWRAYWEHEIGQSDKDQHFNFKQIKLQSFIGHTGSIRCINSLDNENSFITGSKDKTVKLWSLRSCGDGTAQIPCKSTYALHKKSVFSVAFLDSRRLVASCDSTVHIWDPFIGSCIKQLDSSKTSPVTLLTAMPSPSSSFIVATTNSTIRFLDTRTCSYNHEFKVTLGPAGLIRCLSVSPDSNWIAVGHSSGIVSVLDVRTGLLLGSKNCHEGEILQVKAFNNSCFVSSSLDHSVSVWLAEDIKLKCHLRGPMEPVTCLNFYKGEVISGTTANRVGVHSSIDHHSTYSSIRLMSETFKGVLTSMAVLPINRLLLLGADNGTISLLC